MVEEYVGTRNTNQIKNFALKEYGTLEFEKAENISQEPTETAPLNNSQIWNQKIEIKPLETQIKEFIGLAKQFELVYKFHKNMTKNQYILNEVEAHISNIRKIIRNLIQTNTENKRNQKLHSKGERGSIDEIRERLNYVIQDNLINKLGITNLEDFRIKYSKLSDWIERPSSSPEQPKTPFNDLTLSPAQK